MENSIEYKGHTIEIKPDNSAESPDAWNNDSFILGFDSRNFWVERNGFTKATIENALRAGKDEDGERDDEAKQLLKQYNHLLTNFCARLSAYMLVGRLIEN